MDRVVGIAVLVVSLVLLWTHVRHLEFGSFLATVLSFLEILALGVAVYSLGWSGLAVFGIVNVIAVLVWSVILASRVETKLVYAGIQANESKEAMQELAGRLAKQKELKVLGPVERAELVRLLADRNRNIVEIEDMAAPIGMLKTIHEAPLDWLVERFDGILRGADEPASKANETASIIHNTAVNAAASFKEIMDGFSTFYTGEPPPSEDVAA
jgi:hypothetical protein